MKSNREIREEAWGLLWKEGWFGRCLVASVTLALVTGIALGVIALAYRLLDIGTLQDFAAAQQKAASQGLQFSASNSESMLRMLVASLFQNFIQYLLMGIVTYGIMALTLKAARHQREGWLGEAFSGFGAPFTMFWQMFNVQIRTAFWMVLAAIPVGAVAPLFAKGAAGVAAVTVTLALVMLLVAFWLFYRYYCVWYLKADHPDWGAGKCIGESVGMMKNWKGRAVQLDCSYWLSLLWMIPLTGALAWLVVKIQVGDGWGEASPVELAALAGLGLVLLGYGIVLGWYVAIGHAVFYREMSAEIKRSPE